MSLQTALSGLTVAQTGLNTVSNDLANANTTAFKSQTALFSDLYPGDESLYTVNQPGIGAATEELSDDNSQGDLVATGNPLDAAIQGAGYFVVSENGQQQYTRDGAFQLNPQGQLVTADGSQVLGFTTNTNGTPGGALSPITVNTGALPAQASSQIGLTLDLNTGDPIIPAGTAFNPANASTYDEATSVVAYDSLGNANRVGLYFVQNPPATAGTTPSWTVYAQPETPAGAALGTPQTLTTLNFNASGALTSGSPASLNVNWNNGSAASTISFNLTGTTVGAQDFAVAGSTNNGSAPGSYNGLTINDDGVLQATYSNGQTKNAGSLALANFINQAGLVPLSGNLFASSNNSGVPILNPPGVGESGIIKSGNLEQSNASTSTLLVSLIQYQQAYQANTSVIQTEQQDATRLTQI